MISFKTKSAGLAMALAMLAGCGQTEQASETVAPEAAEPATASAPAASVASNPLKNAYFGDTHIHTILSFDAYLMGTRRTPSEAYDFAKGAAIEHASGFMMQMKKPLDFLAVSDHGFYLGMMRELGRQEGPYANHRLADVVRNANDAAGSTEAFQSVLGHLGGLEPGQQDDLDDRAVARSAWQEVIEAAEQHNEPGRFTTFIAYEYTTSGPASENLHRNVIFSGSQVPVQPFTRLDSLNPEDMWAWMDQQRELGMDAIAVPHNSNGSNGWMFETNYFRSDRPIDEAYAELRMRNEPLVENTQVKGTSDTHPLLSPNDEWADFDIMPLRVASTLPSQPHGSYVREAYLNGLLMEAERGVNPYKFGVIGSSDTHNAAGSFEEENYWSKTGFMDIQPHLRGSVPLPGSDPENPEYAQGASQYWGASGLAGVWAESNTRESIFAAMRRKETFSTSGPHIKVRFFAGYELTPDIAEAADVIAQAYAGGVPMGSDLSARAEGVPGFYLWASRDPDTQALQRLQIIKGWLEDGEAHEKVIDVACSDGASPDPETARCPDNGARVSLKDCSTTPDVGAAELATYWQDPDFDPAQKAFYYVRVLENPSCRWSTYDAIRAGVAPRPDMHATLQNRAWSSPIWFMP
ncbi:MAG: DUF3604 domain-containing protein, partial [Pseudomonadales bacterium]